jgi:hypothetical protein
VGPSFPGISNQAMAISVIKANNSQGIEPEGNNIGEINPNTSSSNIFQFN